MASNNNYKCKGWCPPTVIYLTLSLFTTFVSLVTSHYYDDANNEGQNKVLYTISHLLGIAIWTVVLYWLCSKCHYTTAWVVLLLPFILVAFVAIAVVAGIVGGNLLSKQEKKVSTINKFYYV